jgi:hypothetical protein
MRWQNNLAEAAFATLEGSYQLVDPRAWLKPGAWGCQTKKCSYLSAEVFALPK